MIGILAAMDEQERMAELKSKFKRAVDLKETKCTRCGFCCHRRTCIPTPEELIKIAEFLKMTPKEAINKYFVIDSRSDSSPKYVKPAGVNRLDYLGEYLPAEMTYNEGKCIFLDENNLCKIHSVKPEHAKNQKCWSTESSNIDPTESWKEDTLKKQFNVDVW